MEAGKVFQAQGKHEQSPHRKTGRMFREQGGFNVVEMQDFAGRKVKQKARMS